MLDYGDMRKDPPIGEVPGVQGKVRASDNPRYLGLNWCGSAALWTQGSVIAQQGTPPVDQDGVPRCCRSGPADPGGDQVAGEATFTSGTLDDLPLGAVTDISVSPLSPATTGITLSAAAALALEPAAVSAIGETIGYFVDLRLTVLPAPARDMKLQ